MLLSWAQRCGAGVQPLGRTKYGAVQCRRLAVLSITTTEALIADISHFIEKDVSQLVLDTLSRLCPDLDFFKKLQILSNDIYV